MSPELANRLETHLSDAIENACGIRACDNDDEVIVAESAASEAWVAVARSGRVAYVMQISSDDDAFVFERVVGSGPEIIKVEFEDWMFEA